LTFLKKVRELSVCREARPDFVNFGKILSLNAACSFPPEDRMKRGAAFFIPEPLSELGFWGLKDFQDL